MENQGLPGRERGLGVSGAFLPARPPPTPFWSQQTDGHVLVVLRVLCNMNELKKKKKKVGSSSGLGPRASLRIWWASRAQRVPRRWENRAVGLTQALHQRDPPFSSEPLRDSTRQLSPEKEHQGGRGRLGAHPHLPWSACHLAVPCPVAPEKGLIPL